MLLALGTGHVFETSADALRHDGGGESDGGGL